MSLRFSACELCWHFKNDIAQAKSLEERLGQLIKYRQHLADQYQDRVISWGLQELVLDDPSDLVVIQVDGLDQAKFALPRDPKLRATSSVSFRCILVMGVTRALQRRFENSSRFCIGAKRPTAKRPKLKIHGAWAFGDSAACFCCGFTKRLKNNGVKATA